MRKFSRGLRIFVFFLPLFVLLGMAYTAHRGFDWPEIAVISTAAATVTTLVWLRRFPG